MPKTLTPQQKRDRILLGAVARGMVENGMFTAKDLADRLNITSATIYKYRNSAFAAMKLSDFGRMARLLHLTGREVCAALGVPYEDPEEGR